MFQTFMFVCEMYNQIVNSYGQLLFRTFGNYLFLIIFLVAVNFSIFYLKKWNKLQAQNIFIRELILIILFLIIFIIPFQRGNQIEDMKELGYDLINIIEIFKSREGQIPQKLDELYPNYIDSIKYSKVKRFIRYTYFDHIALNEKNASDRGYIPLKEDYFYLSVYDDFLGMERLKYNFHTKRFEISDD